MSTETTTNATVGSMPAVDESQQLEKQVKEDTHAVEHGDIPVSKEGEENFEKRHCDAEKCEGSEIPIIKSEETPVIHQTQPPVVVEVENADYVPVQNVEADHENRAIEAVENVPAGGKPPVEAIANASYVEKISIEASEEAPQKARTIDAVIENEPEKTQAIEDKEADSGQDIKANENNPVEKVAIVTNGNEPETQATEASEKKQEVKIAIEAVEKELEKSLQNEAKENKPAIEETVVELIDEKRPIIEASQSNPSSEIVKPEENEVEKENIEKEPDTQASESCEKKEAVNKRAIEAVAKESEKTQANEADDIKPIIEEQIDEKKPKIEIIESSSSSEVVKPEEHVESEKETIVDEGTTNCAASPEPVSTDICVATNEESKTVEKEAGVRHTLGGLLKGEGYVQSENAAEKEEKFVKTERETEEIDEKTKEPSCENNGTNVADQVADKSVDPKEVSVKAAEKHEEASVVPGEVLIREDEFKDIKVNQSVAVSTSSEETTELDQSCKDGDETQKSKEEQPETVQDVVSAKPAGQKQSGNTIISKVKQSLVKVKKAIIGKSPSSKVLSPEIKGEDENGK